MVLKEIRDRWDHRVQRENVVKMASEVLPENRDQPGSKVLRAN